MRSMEQNASFLVTVNSRDNNEGEMLSEEPGKQSLRPGSIVYLENSNTDKKTISRISVSPNPAKDMAMIDIAAKTAGAVQIEITDMSGKVVKTISAGRTTGKDNFRIPVVTNGLSNGMYIARVIIGKELLSAMFTISR